MPQADSWSAVEREILPSRTQALPALGFVLVGVRAVEVLAAVHGVGRVAYHSAFRDEEGMLAVWAAAEREDGVADSKA